MTILFRLNGGSKSHAIEVGRGRTHGSIFCSVVEVAGERSHSSQLEEGVSEMGRATWKQQ